MVGVKCLIPNSELQNLALIDSERHSPLFQGKKE